MAKVNGKIQIKDGNELVFADFWANITLYMKPFKMTMNKL